MNSPGRCSLGHPNAWPTWRGSSRLMCRRCTSETWVALSRTGVFGCAVCSAQGSFPAMRGAFMLLSHISVSWLRSDDVVLWREHFAALRWKDRSQDTSLWVRRNGLINRWRDLEGRKNKIDSNSQDCKQAIGEFNNCSIFLCSLCTVSTYASI